MKTVLLAISLFSTQPATETSDTQWFGQQAMRDHFVNYLLDDRENLSVALTATLSKGFDCSTQVVQYLVKRPTETTPANNIAYGMRVVPNLNTHRSSVQ